MKKIEAYKLSDGTMVENITEAERLKNELTFTKELNDFVDNACVYTNEKSIVFEAINNNRMVLKEILDLL